MEHQYPGAISGDENMLAELMLPDQVHNRKEDWTIFFLHKDSSGEEEPADGDDSSKEGDAGKDEEIEGQDHTADANDVTSAAKAHNAEDEDDADGGGGPPLIYVLNLVNTKHDPSAKRFVRT
jgi:hypothetical protein